MPVPDEIIFGPRPGSGVYNYGDVRLLGIDDRILAFKLRVNEFLISQISEMAVSSPSGELKVYSPFPLAVMTCIAIEFVGKVFVASSEGTDDPRTCFVSCAREIDGKLFGPMKKGFKKKMRLLWPEADLSKCKNAADVLYKFLRTTMVHGYRAHGVYLTEKETSFWRYGDGFILLNPYGFWDAFFDKYRWYINQAVAGGKGNTVRQSCIEYIKGLLK